MSINHRWRNEHTENGNWIHSISDESYVLRTFHHRTTWDQLPLSLIKDHPSHIKIHSDTDDSDDSDYNNDDLAIDTQAQQDNNNKEDSKENNSNNNESESESKQQSADDSNESEKSKHATKTISLNAEQHASILDFSNDSFAHKQMIDKWRSQLNSFSLRNSSFGCIFDKRYNVLKSLFQHFTKHTNTPHYDPYYQITHNKYKKHSKPDFSTVKVPMKIWHQIPGTNPLLWPKGLNQFILEMISLRDLSLYEERRHILDKFFTDALHRINNENDLQIKGKMISGLLAFVIRNGSAVFMLQIINLLHKYQLQLDNAPKHLQILLLPSGSDKEKQAKTEETENKSEQKEQELQMFGWMHCKVREMLNELNVRLNDYDVTVPRCGSRTMAVQITESARKATEAEKQLNKMKNKTKSNNKKKKKKSQQDIAHRYGMGLGGMGGYGGYGLVSGGRNTRISHGKGFTTDGRFLYVHCSRGLIKIGTGDQNTRKWEFYACKNYRNGEHVQIVWIDGKIYARSIQMKFGIVEVIDCNTLEMQYKIYLGIDCNKSIPKQWKAKDLPMVTDGLYLYLVAYEADFDEYYRKITEYKIKLKKEKEKELLLKKQQEEINKKKRIKQRKERKLGVTPELLQKYKKQHKKYKKNKNKLSPNDKQTQTELSHLYNDKQTQTQTPSKEIVDDIINALIDNVISPSPQLQPLQPPQPPPPHKDDQKEEKQQVELIKIIDFENRNQRNQKKKKKLRKKSKKKDKRDKKEKREKKEKVVAVDEKDILSKIGNPCKKLCLYGYEVGKLGHVLTNDLETSEPRISESVEVERLIKSRKIVANRLHIKYYNGKFSPQLWYRALTVKSDDELASKRWIEEEGSKALQQDIKYAPLIRYLILDSVNSNNGSDDSKEKKEEDAAAVAAGGEAESVHESTDLMFSSNCMFYCSGHQFVILVPPHTNPWTQNTDKWLGRVYRLKDGKFLQDTKQIALKYQATKACVDPLKNLIWFGYLQNDLIFQSYQNHGPAACFYEIADNGQQSQQQEEEEEDKEDTEQDKDKDSAADTKQKQDVDKTDKKEDEIKETDAITIEKKEDKDKDKDEIKNEADVNVGKIEDKEKGNDKAQEKKEDEDEDKDKDKDKDKAKDEIKNEDDADKEVQILENKEDKAEEDKDNEKDKADVQSEKKDNVEILEKKEDKAEEDKDKIKDKDKDNDQIKVQTEKKEETKEDNVEIIEKKEDKAEPLLFYKWQWENDGPVWLDYDVLTNENIEQSFKSAEKTHKFVVGGSKIYEIRFDSLTQCNFDTGFERRIRRNAFDKYGNPVEIKEIQPPQPQTQTQPQTDTKTETETETQTIIKYEWEFEGQDGWQSYDDSVHSILNALDIGDTTSVQFGKWLYNITKVNEDSAAQKNAQTNKVRTARRIKKEEIIKAVQGREKEKEKQKNTEEKEAKVTDAEILGNIEKRFATETNSVKLIFDSSIFDEEVYSYIPNSCEHILEIFYPLQIIQPIDISMFLCGTINRLIKHSSDSTPLPPLNHAIYYAKKKRRKEITEQIEKLKKSRNSTLIKNTKTKKNNGKDNNESDTEKKKRKQAKEWAEKFFKIFDIAHNGDLDFNEFKKGCQIINIQWQTLFTEVQKQREEEKKRILQEEQLKKRREKMKKFHAEIQAQIKKKRELKKQKEIQKEKEKEKESEESKEKPQDIQNKEEKDKPDKEEESEENEKKKEKDEKKEEKEEKEEKEQPQKEEDKDKDKEDGKDKAEAKEKEKEKEKLKEIEYPTKEDQQLRYIYQTIKPASDAEKYLTPKHFEDFLLNQSSEMLNDAVMLLFRQRIKQTIKFYKLQQNNGAWQGWSTIGVDYNKIKECCTPTVNVNAIISGNGDGDGDEYEKKDSNLEIKISGQTQRTIRGSGRDEHGNFTLSGSFKGANSSSINGSEFTFDKTYPGKHTVKYTGYLHDNLSLQGYWSIPTLKLGGFFYFEPLAILQAPLSELEGHGPLLLSHRADTHPYIIELSDNMFTQLYIQMDCMLNKLKKNKQIKNAHTIQYHLNTYLKMFKIHLEQLNYLFSPYNHDGKKEMLKKENKELDMKMWEKLLKHEKNKSLQAIKTVKTKTKSKKETKTNKSKKQPPHEPKQIFPKWSATQNMRKLLLELVFFDDSNLPYRHTIQQLQAKEILSKAVDTKIISSNDDDNDNKDGDGDGDVDGDKKEEKEEKLDVYIAKKLDYYTEIDDDEDIIENIRNESIETLTGAFEMMYPYAEDKLAFLSETIANIRVHDMNDMNDERQKQIHENVLFALFEWFSHQSHLSDYLLPSAKNLKKFNLNMNMNINVITPPSKALNNEQKQIESDMNKPQSLVRTLSEEHSVNVLQELVEFCVEAHERGLMHDLEHHRSAQSAIHLLSSLQKDLILKSQLFTNNEQKEQPPLNNKDSNNNNEKDKTDGHFVRLLQYSSIMLLSATRIVQRQLQHMKQHDHEEKDNDKAADAENDNGNEDKISLSTCLRNTLLSLISPLLTALGGSKIISQRALVSSLVPLVCKFMNELNRLIEYFPESKKFDNKFIEKLANETPVQAQVVETAHPYPSGAHILRQTILFKNCDAIILTFDPRCCTYGSPDQLTIYYDKNLSEPVPGAQFYGRNRAHNGAWPAHSVIILHNSCTLSFSARAQPGKGGDRLRWGIRCVARGVYLRCLPFLFDLFNTTAGIAAKLCSSLLRGESRSTNELKFYPWLLPYGGNEGINKNYDNNHANVNNDQQMKKLSSIFITNRKRKYATKYNGLLSLGLEDPSVTSDISIGKQLCFNSALSPPQPYTPSANQNENMIESKLNFDFLNQFIDGNENTKALQELFIGIKPQKSAIQEIILMRNAKDSYEKSIRAVQSAMLKHGGIATMARQYCDDNNNKPLVQTDLNILKEGLKMIQQQIKPLIDWMTFMNQTAKNWRYWFNNDDVLTKINTYIQSLTDHQRANLDFIDSDDNKKEDDDEKQPEQTDGNMENTEGPKDGKKDDEKVEGGEDAATEKKKEDDGNDDEDESKDDSKDELEELEPILLKKIPHVVFENEYNENKATLYALCTLTRIKYDDNNIIPCIERLYEVYNKEYNEIITNTKAQWKYEQSKKRKEREKDKRDRKDTASTVQTPPCLAIKNPTVDLCDYITSICKQLLLFKSCHSAELLFASKESSKLKYGKDVIAEDIEVFDDVDDFKHHVEAGNNKQVNDVNDDDINEEELAPPKPVLSKSISHDVISKKRKKEMEIGFGLNKRVQGLRNWIGTYKRWKSWQDKSPEINKKISPLQAIIELIKQHLDYNDLITAARSQQLRGLHRQMGLKYLSQLLKSSKFEVARINLVGVLSESLRNSARSFNKKLLSVSKCFNIYDGLGCCDIRIKKSVQLKLSEFISISLKLINNKHYNTSMLTKIILLSDIYGLTFDIDQAHLIKNQQLISFVFKLIKKTQMILPTLPLSPIRSKSPQKSPEKLLQLKSPSAPQKSPEKQLPKLEEKQPPKREEKQAPKQEEKQSNNVLLPLISPSLNSTSKDGALSFFIPQDFDFEFGSFNPVELQQQFEQFMIQNPEAFEQMQNEIAELEQYEHNEEDDYDDYDDDDEEDEEEDENEDDEEQDVDIIEEDDTKLLDFSFNGGILSHINPIEAWEAKQALAAEHAYLQQQAYAHAIYQKQLQHDFQILTNQAPQHQIFSNFGRSVRGGGRGGSRHRSKRSRRDYGHNYRRGRNIKHRLSVFATNRYSFLPSNEIKKPNEKLMEIYFQAQWAALRLLTYQCLQWQQNNNELPANQHSASQSISLNLANIMKHNTGNAMVNNKVAKIEHNKNKNILELMIIMLNNCLNNVSRCYERDRHIALRAANTWLNRLLCLFITYSGDKLSDQQARKLLSGLLYIILNWDKFTFEVFQLSIKLIRKLITWTAADSIKIAQSDKQINPAQLMEMFISLIGQIIHKKAIKSTKYIPSPSPTTKKSFSKLKKNKADKKEEEKNEKDEKTEKDEKEEKTEKDPNIVYRSRRKSLSRSRLMSRYALKTKDSGEFCVVAQGNETVHKWKDVLCHREFEFLLPELTVDDEKGSLLYLVVTEDSDTEYDSDEEDEVMKNVKENAKNNNDTKQKKLQKIPAFGDRKKQHDKLLRHKHDKAKEERILQEIFAVGAAAADNYDDVPKKKAILIADLESEDDIVDNEDKKKNENDKIDLIAKPKVSKIPIPYDNSNKMVEPKFKSDESNEPNDKIVIGNELDWQCSRCTFLNQAHINKCQICAFSKEESAALSAQLQNTDLADRDINIVQEAQEILIDPNAEWQCAMCASINKADALNCGACTYSKAKSVESLLAMQQEKAQMAAALAASKQESLSKLIQSTEQQMAKNVQDAEPEQVDQASKEPPKPSTEKLKAEEAKSDESKPEQLEIESDKAKADQPKPDELKSDQPKVEEPKPKQPKPDQLKTDEPKQDELKPDEPKQDEAKQDEPKSDEPKADEAKADESAVEEAKPEEAKQDELKSDELEPEEAKPAHEAPPVPVPVPVPPREPEKVPPIPPDDKAKAAAAELEPKKAKAEESKHAADADEAKADKEESKESDQAKPEESQVEADADEVKSDESQALALKSALSKLENAIAKCEEQKEQKEEKESKEEVDDDDETMDPQLLIALKMSMGPDKVDEDGDAEENKKDDKKTDDKKEDDKKEEFQQSDVGSAAAALAGLLRDKGKGKGKGKELAKLDKFEVCIGMKFSFVDVVYYEVDSYYITRNNDNYVKCIQQKDKFNKEYPPKIYLSKQQLRYVKSKYMDRLRMEQMENKRIKYKLRKQKIESAPEKIVIYLKSYNDGQIPLKQILSKMKTDNIDPNLILPYIDDEDALKLKYETQELKKKIALKKKQQEEQRRRHEIKLALKRREIEKMKILRKSKREKRQNDRKEKLLLIGKLSKNEKSDLSENAFEKRQTYFVNFDENDSSSGENGIKLISEKCSIEHLDIGWKCTARSNFPTVAFCRGVTSGRWYYEVIIESSGLKQIGFITKNSKPSARNGVGDDKHSWAYDGSRTCLWHKKQIPWDTPRWHKGDSVGVALDCFRKEIKIYLNGQDLGVAFKNVKCKNGIFPAMSIQNNEKATFVFDINHFKHEVPMGYTPFIGDDAKIGNQLRARFTAMTIRQTINDNGYYIILPKSDYDKSGELAQNFSRFGIAVSILPRQYLGALRRKSSAPAAAASAAPPDDAVNATDVDDLKQTAAINDPINSNSSLTVSANVARNVISELISFLRWMLKDEATTNATTGTVAGTQLNNNDSTIVINDDGNTNINNNKAPTLPSIPRHPSTIQRTISSISIQENIISSCSEGEHHDEWREITLQTLANILENPSNEKDLNSFTGALCILGGFCEPLRVGGMIRINNDRFGHNNRGVVVESSRFSNKVHILLQKTKDQYVKQRHTTRIDSTEITPISEFEPSFNVLIRNEHIFDTLMNIIQTDTNNISVKDKQYSWLKILPAADDIDNNVNTILSELRYRAICVIEALLSSETVSEINIMDKAVRFMIEFTLKNNEKRRKLSSGNADNTRLCSVLLRDRLWEINNRILPYFVQTPLAPMETLLDSDINEDCNKPKPFEMVFSSSPFHLESREEIETNKMLSYWEKNIIPRIQDYVRGSFKEYEFDEFFMQLRQPLYSQIERDAIQIAWVICANRIPDTVAFPDPDQDWTTLMYEECFAGQFVYVTNNVIHDYTFEPSLMINCINKIGRVRALDPLNEMVLIQFYDQPQCKLNAYWFDPIFLKEAKPYHLSNFNGWLERYLSLNDCQNELINIENRVVLLVMQRALFTLCCQVDNPLPKLKSLLLSESSASMDPIDFVLSALKQAVNLTGVDTNQLGQPLNIDFIDKVIRLNENLQDYARIEKLTHLNLSTLLIERLEIRLKNASVFYNDNISLRWTRECNLKLRTHSKAISIPGACALIIMFDKESKLPASNGTQPNILTIYNDETCRSIYKQYSGGKLGKGILLPTIIPSFECWIKLESLYKPTPDIKFNILPIHSDIGLSFWIINYLLQSVLSRINNDKADATAIPESIDMCLKLLILLYQSFDLQHMQPSPLKQSIVNLCFNILSTISLLLNKYNTNTIPQQIQLMIDQKLQLFKNMETEINNLFNQEIESGEITTYFQLLIDFSVLCDNLRSTEEKIIKDFNFNDEKKDCDKKQEEKEEKKEDDSSNIWSCVVCTLENPFANSVCSLCASPMPPQKNKQIIDEGANANKLISQFIGLTDSINYLKGANDKKSILSPNISVCALYERAYNCLKEAVNPTKSWFFIKNVPPGNDTDIKLILKNCVENIEDDIRLNIINIFIGQDLSLNDGKYPLTHRRKRIRKEFKPTLSDTSDKELDENGILYNIATFDKTKEYKNPMELGLIKVSAKSIQSDSLPVHHACGRVAVRCVSKREANSWFEFDLINRSVCPTYYKLRHYKSWDTEALRNWLFQGSNDGKKWITIMEHKNDDKLKQKAQIATWKIPENGVNDKTFYRRFRIFMTGTNSNGQYYLALSGFELYGILDSLPIKPPDPQNTHKFAMVEISNSSNEAINAMLGITGMTVTAPEYCLKDYLPKPKPLAPLPQPQNDDIESSAEPPNFFNNDDEDEDDDDDEDDEEEEDIVKGKNIDMDRNADEDINDALDDPMQYVIDPIVSQLSISNFNELSDDNPIKIQYLTNKFLKSYEIEKKEASQSIHDEDTKVDKAKIDGTNEEKKEDDNKETETEKGNEKDTQIETKKEEQQNPEKEKEKEDKEKKIEVANDEEKGNEKEEQQNPEKEKEKEDQEKKIEVANDEEKDGDIDKVEIRYELLKNVSAFFESLLFDDDSKEVIGDDDKLPLLSYDDLMALFVYKENERAEKEDKEIKTAIDALRSEINKCFEKEKDKNITWEKGQDILCQTISNSPLYFMRWIFSLGMDINFERCYHPNFDNAINKQFELQSESLLNSETDKDLIKYALELCEYNGYSSLIRFPSHIIEYPLFTKEENCENAAKYPLLHKYCEIIPIEDLRLRFAFIQQFNIYLIKNALPFINFSRFELSASVSYIICHESESYVFSRIKFDFLQNILDSTSRNVEVTERPKIIINRMKKLQLTELDFLTESNFGHGLSQLLSVDKFLLRPSRPHGAEPFVCFELQLIGQFVEGAAGPYRQYFNDVGKELQSKQSLIFCPTPNSIEAKHKINANLQNINKFILRPSIPNNYKYKDRISETEHLKMFEFLGLLFGCCIRSGVRMPLDLSPLVWKTITRNLLTKKDLLSIDKTFYDLLEGMRNMNGKEFDQTFGPQPLDHNHNDNDSDGDDDDDVKTDNNNNKQLYFTTMLSDKQTSVDLKPNGSIIAVTYDNRLEFIKLCYEARLSEHDTLIDSIRRGIDKIVPIDSLNIMNWRELEILICGKKKININLLRRHTNYSSGLSSSNQHIQWFWEVLSEFCEENKTKFIRFAWAQERLPSDDDEFILTHTRLMIKPSSAATKITNQDLLLPKADTCFFNLELPKYSSKQILRDKLLLAITMSLSMNGDDPDSRDDQEQFDLNY